LETKPTIETVTSAIAQWREQGGRRLPSLLWEQLAILKKEHSIAKLSAATGISGQYLRRRLGKKLGKFVEVKMALPQTQEISSSFEVGMMEVRRPDGTLIRVRVSSGEAASLLRRWLQ
jgi:hypothetical protein